MYIIIHIYNIKASTSKRVHIQFGNFVNFVGVCGCVYECVCACGVIFKIRVMKIAECCRPHCQSVENDRIWSTVDTWLGASSKCDKEATVATTTTITNLPKKTRKKAVKLRTSHSLSSMHSNPFHLPYRATIAWTKAKNSFSDCLTYSSWKQQEQNKNC